MRNKFCKAFRPVPGLRQDLMIIFMITVPGFGLGDQGDEKAPIRPKSLRSGLQQERGLFAANGLSGRADVGVQVSCGYGDHLKMGLAGF